MIQGSYTCTSAYKRNHDFFESNPQFTRLMEMGLNQTAGHSTHIVSVDETSHTLNGTIVVLDTELFSRPCIPQRVVSILFS